MAMTQNSQITLRKNIIGRSILPNFKTYWKHTIIKTLKYWQKDRHLDHWNIIEGPELDIHIYAQLIYDNSAKITQ